MHLDTITWSHFEKIDIRVGTIIEVQHFAGAKKPAYKLLIDFGAELGNKCSSAQITKHYKPEELVGQQIIAIVNFPPKQIANFFSECLILGIYDNTGDVILLKPERIISNGNKVG